MKITITRDFDSVEAALAFLQGAESVNPCGEQATETKVEPSEAETVSKKRGRKPAAEKASEPTAAKANDTPDDGKVYSLADLHKAGTVYLNTHGMEAMMNLMGKYKAQRTGEIKEEDRGAFIADCENNVVIE